jgi:hypothetical protein
MTEMSSARAPRLLAARHADPLPDNDFVGSPRSKMRRGGAIDVGTFGDSGAGWTPYQPANEVSAET